ncbi:hypothetical protein K3495_g6093 [Podosphaera aphanis]|nr:hypothetical protein K3495_g6093 [Podosphaera aphanis]
MLKYILLHIPRNSATLTENNFPSTAGNSEKKLPLPSQLGSLIGAYLIAVCIVGLVLTCLSRRRRNRTHMSSGILNIEMMESLPQKDKKSYSHPSFLPGRISSLPWISSGSDTSHRSSPTAMASPGVDIQVVEADREKLSRDLEAIYAHVMAEEDVKASCEESKDLRPSLQQRQSIKSRPINVPQLKPKSEEQKEESNPTRPETKTRSKTASRALSLLSSFKSPRKKFAQPLVISSPILISSPGLPRIARSTKVVMCSDSHMPLQQQEKLQPTNSQQIHPYTRELPLRQFEHLSQSASGMSSGPTTITILERAQRPDSFLQTGTPWSAGAVPYSPYQPYSPVIPVTPKLATREEIKTRRKLEAKTHGLELIKSEEELWDSAY